MFCIVLFCIVIFCVPGFTVIPLPVEASPVIVKPSIVTLVISVLIDIPVVKPLTSKIAPSAADKVIDPYEENLYFKIAELIKIKRSQANKIKQENI